MNESLLVDLRTSPLARFLCEQTYQEIEAQNPELLEALRACHDQGLSLETVKRDAMQTLGFHGESQVRAIDRAYQWIQYAQDKAPAAMTHKHNGGG